MSVDSKAHCEKSVNAYEQLKNKSISYVKTEKKKLELNCLFQSLIPSNKIYTKTTYKELRNRAVPFIQYNTTRKRNKNLVLNKKQVITKTNAITNRRRNLTKANEARKLRKLRKMERINRLKLSNLQKKLLKSKKLDKNE